MTRQGHPTERWQQHFHGKTAIVTGGASGIGAALSSALAASGAHVVLADLDGDGATRAARTIQQVTGDGGSVRGVQLDVTNRAAVKRLVLDTVEREDGLDFLFNNAGIGGGGPTEHVSPEHWDRTIDVNLGGVVNGVIAALPGMVARGEATSSTRDGRDPDPRQGPSSRPAPTRPARSHGPRIPHHPRDETDGR